MAHMTLVLHGTWCCTTEVNLKGSQLGDATRRKLTWTTKKGGLRGLVPFHKKGVTRPACWFGQGNPRALGPESLS